MLNILPYCWYIELQLHRSWELLTTWGFEDSTYPHAFSVYSSVKVHLPWSLLFFFRGCGFRHCKEYLLVMEIRPEWLVVRKWMIRDCPFTDFQVTYVMSN